MAILKYGPGISPIRNEHSGFTFQSGRASNSCGKCQSNDRARYANQTNKQVNLMKCTREWRNMSPATKSAWSTFAATYPQPCKKDSSKYLTGYQLFLKRNQYLFLNEGISEPFLEAPLMQVLALATVSFSIEQTENCADVTESYIKAFGILPAMGDTLFLKVIPMAVHSGQMFPVIEQQIIVNETYLDGMFLSLEIPLDLENIVFSLYISLPINPSVKYAGTKTRYMGCFTTKTFISLTDAPDSYTGQAGKVAAVKADETGLEFIAAGGGGLTCATVMQCTGIITIVNNLISLENQFFGFVFSSQPPILFGLLYNHWAVVDPRNIAPVGWEVWLYADYTSLVAYYGGSAVAGGPLKYKNFEFWGQPNTGATNASLICRKGSGKRLAAGTSYSGITSTGTHWIADPFPGNNGYTSRILNTSAAISSINTDKNEGLSCQIIRRNPGTPDGTISNMTGHNGRIYRTIVQNNIEWVADPYCETIYRNGDPIPLVTDSAAWSLLASPGYCYPNGNSELV